MLIEGQGPVRFERAPGVDSFFLDLEARRGRELLVLSLFRPKDTSMGLQFGADEENGGSMMSLQQRCC